MFIKGTGDRTSTESFAARPWRKLSTMGDDREVCLITK